MTKEELSLIGSNPTRRTTRCSCCAKITIVVISSIVILFLLGIGILVALKYVASTSDADKWIKIGNDNANRDLDEFDTIAANLVKLPSEFTALNPQLVFLKEQIDEAAENNRKLIPNIVGIVEKIDSLLSSDDPDIFSKITLKFLIWFIDGIRDNKSYYLLDGAQLWCELRIKVLQKHANTSTSSSAVTTINQLITEFESVQNSTIGVRDQLDGLAQIFVKGVKKIHSMTGDIGGNLTELKQIAKELLEVSEQKVDFLQNNKNLEKEIDELVRKYTTSV